ncbi:YceD family protein [Piscibacillus halophilus]|uniref:YceD family protein n=1 Tax=Piscibacillus halophilus TaxID=571933 RepID=UPI00158ECAF3|nr:YceD family protein [Piscibacillus halophilus]
MKFSLQKIKREAPYDFEDTVNVDELESMDNDIRNITDVKVKGEATVQGESFTFRYTVKGTMTLPCARTLVDVPYQFDVQAVDRFTTVEYEAKNNEDIHFINQEVLDLLPYIKENILLEVPIRVYSDEATIDNIVSEGSGWDLLQEDEHEELKAKHEEEEKEKVDPRLSSLKNFFNDKND